MTNDFYNLVKEVVTGFDRLAGFENSEFIYPLLYGITGEKTPSLETIRQALDSVKSERANF